MSWLSLFLTILAVAGAGEVGLAEAFGQTRSIPSAQSFSGPDYGTFVRPYTGGGFRRSRNFYNNRSFYYGGYGGYAYPVYVESPPVYYPPPPPPEQRSYYPPEPPPAPKTATIDLYVPTNAEVWFQGRKTNQTGSFRQFITPPLDVGVSSSYELQVRWTDQDGQAHETTRQLTVQPGSQLMLNLQEPPKK